MLSISFSIIDIVNITFKHYSFFAVIAKHLPSILFATIFPNFSTSDIFAGNPGSRSYLAGISYSFDTSNSPFCAGTLISDQWLLTTASCSYSDTKKTGEAKVNVVLGEETLGTPQAENFKVMSSKVIQAEAETITTSAVG